MLKYRVIFYIGQNFSQDAREKILEIGLSGYGLSSRDVNVDVYCQFSNGGNKYRRLDVPAKSQMYRDRILWDTIPEITRTSTTGGGDIIIDFLKDIITRHGHAEKTILFFMGHGGPPDSISNLREKFFQLARELNFKLIDQLIKDNKMADILMALPELGNVHFESKGVVSMLNDIRYCCHTNTHDFENMARDRLYFRSLSEALMTASLPVYALCFESCVTACVEIAYTLRKCCDYITAVSKESHPFDNQAEAPLSAIHGFLAYLATGPTASDVRDQMSSLLTSRRRNGGRVVLVNYKVTVSCALMDEVFLALEHFLMEMRGITDSQLKDNWVRKITEARGNSDPHGIRFDGSKIANFVDIVAFFSKLSEIAPDFKPKLNAIADAMGNATMPAPQYREGNARSLRIYFPGSGDHPMTSYLNQSGTYQSAFVTESHWPAFLRRLKSLQ